MPVDTRAKWCCLWAAECCAAARGRCLHCISIASFLPGPGPQEEFLENLHKAAAALQRTLPRVIEFIAGKRISEL